jgi:hypothetical protein
MPRSPVLRLGGCLATLSLLAGLHAACAVYDSSLLSAQGGETGGVPSLGSGGGSAQGGGGRSGETADSGGGGKLVDAGLIRDALGGNVVDGGQDGEVPDAACLGSTFEQGPWTLLIADFETGNAVTEFAPTCYLFSYDDGTDGGVIMPPPDNVLPTLLAGDAGAGLDVDAGLGLSALHTTGAGFRGYGGGVGLKCPLPIDASTYTGISFWLRGAGTVSVAFADTNTDGSWCCPTKCGDGFQAVVTGTDQWQLMRVKWSELHQSGYGYKTTFDPKGILGVSFGSNLRRSWDFWIDNVSFTQ